MSPRLRPALAAAALASCALAPRLVRAAEYIVESATLGDAYQLVTSGQQLLNRWQLNQLLGLSIWETADPDGGQQHWSFSSLFRFDLDLGLTEAELAEIPTLDRSRPSIQ